MDGLSYGLPQPVDVPPNAKAHLYLTLVSLIYGANYTIAKLVLDDDYLGPNGLTVLRVLTGLLLFTLIHQVFIKEKIDRNDFPKLVWCAITGVAVNQLMFNGGLKLTSHIHAALLTTMVPVATLVAGFFLLNIKIKRNQLIGIGFGMAGVAILTLYGKNFAYKKSAILGDLMIFANACFFGTFLVLVKSLMHKYHPITVARWIFTIGIFLVLPLGYHELKIAPMNDFTLHIWMALGYVLLFTTFFAYLLNVSALKLVDASTVSIYVYLQPVIATTIAVLAGKDELSLIKVTAGAFIFLGVYLVSKK